MKGWLRRHGVTAFFALAVGLYLLLLPGVMQQPKLLPTMPAPAQKSEDRSELSALLEVGGESVPLVAEYPEGNLNILSAPPWTKLEQADLAKLAEGYTSNIELPGLPPVERQQQRTEALEGELSETGYFPYVFSGGIRLRGSYRALIEDADSGASYFRSEGESLGNFSVSEVRPDSLLLIHEKTGKRIRLLKTPGK